jgi:hypothetical protein
MDIQALGGSQVSAVTGTTPTSTTSPPPTPSLDGTLGTISSMLGMSLSSVQTALRGGQSVNDLIAQTGASTSSIISAVANQVQQARQANGLPAVDPSTLDRLINRALERHRNVPSVQPPSGTVSGTATTPITPDVSALLGSSATDASSSGSASSNSTLLSSLPAPYAAINADLDADSSTGLSIFA